MRLWRIAAETRSHLADDLSGAGSAKNPGRWNDSGEPVLYAATTIAIAVLETASHIDDGGLPLDRYVVVLEVPDRVWAAREVIDRASLPPTWAAIPAGQASIRIGSAWLTSARSAILEVPSVIVPEESAALVNPLHPDSKGIGAKVIRSFDYNRLFRSGGR